MIAHAGEFKEKCSRGECRSCRTVELKPVLDLGMMPLSDGLLTEGQLTGPESTYPLETAFCPKCSLVQILETVSPETLFCRDYPYYSSFSETLLAHSRKNVLNLIDKYRLNAQSLVIELASNDGYLLKNFVEFGIPVLGIDPAEGPVQAAEKIGIPTLCAFFGKTLAEQLRDEGCRADVIIANNVLAHVADTNGFVKGIKILLKEEGVAVIEVPYVRNLVERCEFDTIYHEHLCYFSITSVERLFRRHDLFLNEVEPLSIHGGSVRLYFSRQERAGESVQRLLAQERELGIGQYPYYEDFSRRVLEIRKAMRELLARLKSDGKNIAAYGAAAKGTILLNFIGAGKEVIDFVVDRNIHKQGKFMPGVHIPIGDPGLILKTMPDYVLILPWNFKEEILQQQETFRRKGGKFIVPIPSPIIV